MFEELRGKVAVVTGGARGIGRAIAARLAEQRARVVIGDIDGATANRTAAELGQDGAPVEARFLDVGDPASIRSFVQDVLDAHGRVDILVNNAGIVSRVKAEELSLDGWDRTLRVNLRGVFLMTRAVFPAMLAQRSGSVVNMSSLAGLQGGIAVGPDYVASKAGLIGLTRHFALLGAPANVRVNAICPGIIDSEVTTSLGPQEVNRLREMAPLARIGTMDEVAKVALFLASDMSSYVTGEAICVTGGILA